MLQTSGMAPLRGLPASNASTHRMNGSGFARFACLATTLTPAAGSAVGSGRPRARSVTRSSCLYSVLCTPFDCHVIEVPISRNGELFHVCDKLTSLLHGHGLCSTARPDSGWWIWAETILEPVSGSCFYKVQPRSRFRSVVYQDNNDRSNYPGMKLCEFLEEKKQQLGQQRHISEWTAP
jgi:hypothetical protein